MKVTGTVEVIGIIFKPFGTKAFFPFPMYSLYNSIIDIHDLDIPWLKELEEQIHTEKDNAIRIRSIEQAFKKALRDHDFYNLNRLSPSIRYASEDPFVQLDRMAEISCWSNKQYKRVFSEYVGINPKEFLRIIRFQRAIHLLQVHPEMKLQEIAFDCGYYDLPHLSRDFKSFTGYTLKEYTSRFFPYSDYYPEK
ncbi:MAG: helix-turn-helix domain-containing protein [Tannerellaceae bacterium]|nr:helix-turn-helix domain-containing protein [Tannerellaceae bacterium]